MTPEPIYPRTRLPEAASGDWRIEHFEVPPAGPHHSADPRPAWARCPAGRYTRLAVGRTVMMTDTFEEWTTQRHAISRACRAGGAVLVSGLGLGVAAESMLATPGSRVERITVVEASRDVIALVAPHLLERYCDRLEIVHADAFSWTPPKGARFSVGWHDIWPNPYDTAILVEMDRLENRYRHCCDWQGCWGRELTGDAHAQAVSAVFDFPVHEA